MGCTLNGTAFQVLRVYAISGRRWQFAILVAMLCVLPLASGIVRDMLYFSLSSIYFIHGRSAQIQWAASAFVTMSPLLTGCGQDLFLSLDIYNR